MIGENAGTVRLHIGLVAGVNNTGENVLPGKNGGDVALKSDKLVGYSGGARVGSFAPGDGGDTYVRDTSAYVLGETTFRANGYLL